jgi:hypothetical protein
MPFGLGIALGISVSEFKLRQLHLDVLTIDLPLDLAAHLIKQDSRLLKHTGHADTAALNMQLRAAAFFTEFEIQLGISHSRMPSQCCCRAALDWIACLQADALRLALHFVLLGGRNGSKPLSLELGQHALGPQIAQPSVHRGIQRQAIRDQRECGQIQFVGGKLAAHLIGARTILQAQAHIAARPAQAIAQFESEVLRAECQQMVVELQAQAPCKRIHRQGLQVATQTHIDISQCGIHRAIAHLTPIQHKPAPQCAAAFADVHAQIGILA